MNLFGKTFKIIISFIFISFFCFSCFSENKVSDECIKLLDEIYLMRMSNTFYDSRVYEEAVIPVNNVREFRNNKTDAIDSLVSEEKLIIESLLAMEDYYYRFEFPSERETLKKDLKAIVDSIEKFSSGKKTEILSPLFLTTKSDLLSVYVSVSPKDTLKYGLTLKSLYEKALSNDPHFTIANMNLGQWYYWAPAIGGGSRKKAEYYCEIAYKDSEKIGEKFYACFLYSQMLFVNKKFQKASEILEEGLSFFPESKMLLRAKALNSKGISYMEGTGFKVETEK